MQENDNVYVSSRGILKSCDFCSITPRSSNRQLYNYPNLEKIKNIINPSIYICSSAIPHFINTILPTIDFSFILVSGDCDETIPDTILNNEDFNRFINDDRILHWYCQNMIIEHTKIIKIPIGLDYHTMNNNPCWGPITNCENQEKILNSIIDGSIPFWERNIKCYANFHFSMNTKLGYDRKDALKNIDKNEVYYEETKITRLETWNKQKDYAFVICPHGGGLDCHRNWEALCLGGIPIVKSSQIDSLYNELPVLIIDDWSHINSKLLNTTIIEFKNKFENNEFKMEKLHLEYWINLINHSKKI